MNIHKALSKEFIKLGNKYTSRALSKEIGCTNTRAWKHISGVGPFNIDFVDTLIEKGYLSKDNIIRHLKED